MFIKQLVLILRNLWRFRLYSFLNLVGLAIALAVATLIFIYVREEVSYDRHFPNADRIYRIVNFNTGGPRARKWANGAPLMAENISRFLPEIESLTRFRPVGDAVLEYYKDSTDVISHYDGGGFFADSTFRHIFDVNILHGKSQEFLTKPGTIVLTRSLSEKFFGEDVPLGKNIYFQGLPWEITAVCADFPEQQHFHPTYFLPWENFKNMIFGAGLSDLYNSHGWSGVYTYALLDENSDERLLQDKLMDFRVDFYSEFMEEEEIRERGRFVLQPLKDIHLKSHLEQEIEAGGKIVYVLVAIIAAIFILIIAGVNYVNLATVKAFKRMREIGIRKVNGASKTQLVFQFLGESLFMTFLGGLLAIFIMDLLLPVYNVITELQIESIDILTFRNIVYLCCMVMLLAIFAGSYPAFFASGTGPLQAINEMKNPGSRANRLRIGLVILQFTVSIFMILATITIYRQMYFFLNKDLGWDKENIIALNLNGQIAEKFLDNPETIKEELRKLSFVQNVTMVSHLPGNRFSVEALIPDIPRKEEDVPSIRFLRVDEDFIQLMGIKITLGRDLRRTTGKNSEFLLNQSAANILKLEEPMGVEAETLFGQKGEIVGVTEDFHFAALQQQIEPLVLEVNYDPEFRRLWSRSLLLRLTSGDLAEKIKSIEARMKELEEGYYMDYTFLEENVNNNYKSEKRLKELLRAFAIMAILISCLGLFGLSAFSAELRTKEMGIRKTMGATIGKIAFLISKEFIFYVLISIVIALPGGYFLMNKWLQNFAYHVSIQWWEFLLALLLATIITIISVGYQAIRSGLANPVDSLRYE